eukprot:TRINITY_DN612_c0_g1_i1.p1 TRINITY_DN612_c0_g1~~TRINITY_DN612_c0_g1_i1.p1  ORF type:complete len:662 (+),score=93.59 TRINITY_DN612_c0_g1_i1:70-2055(+)
MEALSQRIIMRQPLEPRQRLKIQFHSLVPVFLFIKFSCCVIAAATSSEEPRVSEHITPLHGAGGQDEPQIMHAHASQEGSRAREELSKTLGQDSSVLLEKESGSTNQSGDHAGRIVLLSEFLDSRLASLLHGRGNSRGRSMRETGSCQELTLLASVQYKHKHKHRTKKARQDSNLVGKSGLATTQGLEEVDVEGGEDTEELDLLKRDQLRIERMRLVLSGGRSKKARRRHNRRRNKRAERANDLVSSAAVVASPHTTLRAPVIGNIDPDGLYYMSLSLGTPPRNFNMDIDTGSDLSWVQCSLPERACDGCAVTPSGFYEPKKSPTSRPMSCSSPYCTQAQLFGPARGCVSAKNTDCHYTYTYGDGSSSTGMLYSDVLRGTGPGPARVNISIILGCAYQQRGMLMMSPSPTAGIMGLGTQSISIPQQLVRAKVIKDVLGQCLGGEQGGGYFFLGDGLVPKNNMTWTTMAGKPAAPYYFVNLNAIFVNNKNLSVAQDLLRIKVHTDQLYEGTILDSGSTLNYFITPVYATLTKAILSNVNPLSAKALSVSRDGVTDYCWLSAKGPPYNGKRLQSVSQVRHLFPNITLSFDGRTTMLWTPQSYLFHDSTNGQVCLGILEAQGPGPGSVNIIGDQGMRNLLVIYDNARKMIGWRPTNCTTGQPPL